MADGGKNIDKATQLKFNQMSSSIALGAFSLQPICDIVEIAGSLIPLGAGIAAVAGGSNGPFVPRLIINGSWSGIVARAASFPAVKIIPGIEMAVAISPPSPPSPAPPCAKSKPPVKAADCSATVAGVKFLASVDIARCRRQRRLGHGGGQYTGLNERLPHLGQDTAAITYKLTGSTLTQIGTVGTGIAVRDPEPVTKTVANAVSGVSSAAAYAVLASSRYWVLGQGKYAEIVSKIGGDASRDELGDGMEYGNEGTGYCYA